MPRSFFLLLLLLFYRTCMACRLLLTECDNFPRAWVATTPFAWPKRTSHLVPCFKPKKKGKHTSCVSRPLESCGRHGFFLYTSWKFFLFFLFIIYYSLFWRCQLYTRVINSSRVLFKFLPPKWGKYLSPGLEQLPSDVTPRTRYSGNPVVWRSDLCRSTLAAAAAVAPAAASIYTYVCYANDGYEFNEVSSSLFHITPNVYLLAIGRRLSVRLYETRRNDGNVELIYSSREAPGPLGITGWETGVRWIPIR